MFQLLLFMENYSSNLIQYQVKSEIFCIAEHHSAFAAGLLVTAVVGPEEQLRAAIARALANDLAGVDTDAVIGADSECEVHEPGEYRGNEWGPLRV